MVEGGWILGMDLDLIGSGRIGLNDCKTALVQNIRPGGMDLEMETSELPWNCKMCSGIGPSEVLHPEATWCKFCGCTKLACAESLMTTFLLKVTNTWVGRPAERVGMLVVSAIEPDVSISSAAPAGKKTMMMR